MAPTLSHNVAKLLEVMSKGAGKTSSLDRGLLEETLQALGWSMSETVVNKKISGKVLDESWLRQYRASLDMDMGVTAPTEIQFHSKEDLQDALRHFPVKINKTVPQLDAWEKHVQFVDPVPKGPRELRYFNRDGTWEMRPDDRAHVQWRLTTKGWWQGRPAIVFTAKNGSNVTVSDLSMDSKPTVIASFWTWAYKNGLQQAATEALAGAVLAPKPLAPGDRTLDNTGTCPVCLHNVKLTNGRIMRHGWAVQGDRGRGQYGNSWHSGPCSGFGYEPWEISPKGAVDYAAYLDKLLPPLEQQLRILQAKPAEIRNPNYVEKHNFFKEPEKLTSSDAKYEAALKILVDRKLQEVRYLKQDIAELKTRIAAWVPKALYGKVADRWMTGN